MFRRDDIRIIIITLIGVFLLSFAVEAKTVNCRKHPIYCQIKKNRPKIGKVKALHLSNVIHKVARTYHVPTRIFVGILAQESGYSLEARGCHRGLVEISAESSSSIMSIAPPRVEYKEVKVCADFGIGQIYYRTAKGFGFDLVRLTTDLEYSVEASAKVLADFQKRYSAREVDWWLRYNCGTRGSTKRDTCQIYKRLVKRYF